MTDKELRALLRAWNIATEVSNAEAIKKLLDSHPQTVHPNYED